MSNQTQAPTEPLRYPPKYVKFSLFYSYTQGDNVSEPLKRDHFKEYGMSWVDVVNKWVNWCQWNNRKNLFIEYFNEEPVE